MHVRRTVATVVAGGALLLGLGAIPAAAADRTVPYGRNAPVLISPPGAKWTASAQGEGVMNAKGEILWLQGRGAALETAGVKRIRIYDVKLQRLRNGAWETASQELRDKTDERQPAHAAVTTPRKEVCWSDPTFKRTYRVVQRHAVRRTDNVVSSTRTVYSKSFVFRGLADDPDCKNTQLDADVEGPEEITEGDRVAYDVTVSNPPTNELTGPNDPADNVTAHVFLSDGLKLVSGALPAGCGPEPNPAMWNESDVACNAGHLNAGQSKTFSLTVDALPTGLVEQSITVFSDSSSPWAGSWGQDGMNVTVAIPPPPGQLDVDLEYGGQDPAAWSKGTEDIVEAKMRFTSTDPDGGDGAGNAELRVTFSDGLGPTDPSGDPGGPGEDLLLSPDLRTPEPNDWYVPIFNLEAGQTESFGWVTTATAVGEQTITAQLVSDFPEVSAGEATLEVTVVEPPTEG